MHVSKIWSWFFNFVQSALLYISQSLRTMVNAFLRNWLEL